MAIAHQGVTADRQTVAVDHLGAIGARQGVITGR
jgi:hypothetical protein